jgi:hypothetical protein
VWLAGACVKGRRAYRAAEGILDARQAPAVSVAVFRFRGGTGCRRRNFPLLHVQPFDGAANTASRLSNRTGICATMRAGLGGTPWVEFDTDRRPLAARPRLYRPAVGLATYAELRPSSRVGELTSDARVP